ncbi:MAG: hypothetical protein WB711_03155 [Terriglobales bacterium]
MNPQDQLMELLEQHKFDLVRQRKHRIYRNPDGLVFVTASTPSDRRSPHNALADLRRILRRTGPVPTPPVIQSAPASVALDFRPTPQSEPVVVESAPGSEPRTAPMSGEEWEAWKRQYWRSEKLRAKNEKFLSAVSAYVDRASELLRTRNEVTIGPATDAVKAILRGLQYKSKVLLYGCKLFHQGVVVFEGPDHPILWASNGHIGISASLFVNAYIQHGPARITSLRFDWDGVPALFELPEKSR